MLVGYARDRHASAAVPPTGPAVMYGLRAVVTLPASGNSTTRLRHLLGQRRAVARLERRRPSTASITTAPGADPALGGRFYDAVVALPDNRYVVATHERPRRHRRGCSATRRPAWARSTAGSTAAASSIGATSLHALALLGDGSVLAAGESIDAAVSANRQMLVAKIATTGAMAAFGTGGIARTRVAGGNNTGQAIAVQGDGNVLVGGSANLAGKTAFALTRFTAGRRARRHVRQPRPDGRRRSARRRSTATSPAWRSRATCSPSRAG